MHTTPALGNLSVSRHPLIEHKLSIARDRTTTTKLFKELVEEIAMLMAYEATSDLPLEAVDVSTPLESMRGRRVSGKKLTLVPVLRAGLGMVEGVLRLVPSARVGHIGMYRDHDTLEPVDYYFKVPGDVAERHFFVLDPMLATGGSAVAAVSSLKRAGATRIRFLCIVAAPAGVERMERVHPDVPVYAAALDRELNAQGYIVPGLGDAAIAFSARADDRADAVSRARNHSNQSRGQLRCCHAASNTQRWAAASITSDSTRSNHSLANDRSPTRRHNSPTRYVSTARSSRSAPS